MTANIVDGNIRLKPDPDRLYRRLPALYRIADEQQGGPLRSLLALITEQADALRTGTEQLYDDAFIETCERWAVPYIGELVGNRPLYDLDPAPAAVTAEQLFPDLAGDDLQAPREIRTRADVAKTIYYRRRKGTPAMLEELARDVTGWGARVVEFFSVLDWNQHLEHLRPTAEGCPDLRRIDTGDRVGGAWDTTTHTVDVRRINEWDGWYNLGNIGFFLWRLRAYRLRNVTPRAVGGSNFRLTFSPLGCDTPLFSAGPPTRDASHRASEPNVEAPIRAAAFLDDAAARPSALPPSTVYYGDPLVSDASVVVLSNGAPVPPSEIACVNLEGWQALAQPGGRVIGLDVTRGRLLVPAERAHERLSVSYFYGFSAPLGGGEYERAKWLVRSHVALDVRGGGTALQDAINQRAGSPTVITISDSASYDITLDLTLAEGESLTIQAADQARPHLRVRLPNGEWALGTTGPGASLTLGGLLLEGAVRVDGDVSLLRLLHSTLVPGRSVEQEAGPSAPSGASVIVPADTTRNAELKLQIAFSIVGALRVPAHVEGIWLLDSIVDGGVSAVAVSGFAPDTSAASAHIERCTLLGACRFLRLPLASESIFSQLVEVEEQQRGCMRFSFVPVGSSTPQQYQCQPARQIALEKAAAVARQGGVPLSSADELALRANVVAWLVPSFEALRYGQPGYAQLRLTAPAPIRTGAADGSEQGAFCFLKQPQREANLRLRLDEYLPVGLTAGLIFVT